MRERPSLTDGQLRQWNAPTKEAGRIRTELLALRAERAKPTPSDEERARELIKGIECNGDDDPNPWDVMKAVKAFASIRAEGSAERAKLEAALIPIRQFARANGSGQIVGMIDQLLPQPAESGATERTEYPFAAEIARLREIAEKATPGPWEWVWNTDYANLENSDGARVMSDGSACGEYGPDIKPDGQDGVYVSTFDPPTVLALLDALEQAQKERGSACHDPRHRRDRALAARRRGAG